MQYITLILIIPLVLAVLQLMIGRWEKLRNILTIVFAALNTLLSLLFYINFNEQNQVINLFTLAPNLSIALSIDGLSMLFLLVCNVLWLATSVYSIAYMRSLEEQSQTRFFIFFSLSIFSTLGVIFSKNLLTLYLFYEFLSFATYPLVTHHQDEDAQKGGRKYLTYILGSSLLLLLPAMIITYMLTGSLDFVANGILEGNVKNGVSLVLLFMFTYGFAKAALVPLHSWLPGAMVAPTPVSSLLHAVAVVKVGVFSILKIVTGIFGINYLRDLEYVSFSVSDFFVVIAAVSILYPSLVALSQDNLKRRLAFSTISQLAYITLGTFLLSEISMTAAGAHIAMHAFAKITLFFAAGAIFVAHGKKYVRQLKGLAYHMPITFTAFAIGAAGVVGIPFTGGFISKWNLLLGALDSGHYLIVAVFLLSSLLSAYYLFHVVFVGLQKVDEIGEKKEAPLLCLIPIVFTAAMTIILFFMSTDIFNLLDQWIKN